MDVDQKLSPSIKEVVAEKECSALPLGILS